MDERTEMNREAEDLIMKIDVKKYFLKKRTKWWIWDHFIIDKTEKLEACVLYTVRAYGMVFSLCSWLYNTHVWGAKLGRDWMLFSWTLKTKIQKQKQKVWWFRWCEDDYFIATSKILEIPSNITGEMYQTASFVLPERSNDVNLLNCL